ncbi:MAG: hypothetical protein CBD16_05670 [Betaproteobacteria bacterium TMED156]|nr:MAG: hypothetical protein CBD16_05670 [Betaproteobacteria bacterium TMED156]
MKIPNRIQWHEGMLLSPQHFQVESARVDEMIALHTMAVNSNNWGVRKCRFDVSLLASGRLRILELDALMPNGYAIEHDVNAPDSDLLELNLDEFKDHLKDKSLDVFLGMATRRSMNDSDGISMFRSLVSEPVKDEVSNAVDANIPRLKTVLRLFAGDPPPGVFTSFQICSVVNDNDVIHLGDTLSPMVDLKAAPKLLDEIRNFIETLRGKATFIARQINGQQDTQKTEEKFFLTQRLNSLVSALPLLEGIIQSKFISPYSMYLGLCNILGSLSQIRSGSLPPSPPAYDHASPHKAFKSLLGNLNNLINEVSQDYREIPFVWNDLFFELALRREWINKTLIIGTKGLKSSDADKWLSSVIIGEKNSMEDLREKRVLGSKRRRVKDVDDLRLKSLPGISLFEILTPKSLSEEDNRLVFTPSNRDGIINKPDSLLLFVKG